MTTKTNTTAEFRARAIMSGDWDENGTVSAHVPADVAVDLLVARGWRFTENHAWTSPSLGTYWSVDEALAIALVAEVQS